MDNKIIPVILAITVGIVVIAGALMPVLDDAAAETTTYSNRNDAMFNMVEINENTTYVFEWKYTDPTNAIVNGETVSLVHATILCSVGDFLIRYGEDGNGYYIQGVGTPGNIFVNSSSSANDLTITFSDGVMTAVYGENTVTGSVTDGFGIAKSGDWVMKSPNQSAYVFNDSRIVAMGLTSMDTWSRGFYIDGTVESVNVTCFNSEDFTTSNVVINSDRINNYNDLYTIDSITFDASNGSDTWSATYNYFIVPAEITAEKTNGAPLEDYKGIVFTIPVIVIASLLIMAISLTRRY